MHAHKIFSGESSTLNPFIITVLVPENGNTFDATIDSLLLSRDAQNEQHLRLAASIQNTAPSIAGLAILNKQQFANVVADAFIIRLKEIIDASRINIKNIAEFINFILNQDIALATKINFYSQLYWCRDVKKIYIINDQFDLLHFSAAPYVDYF